MSDNRTLPTVKSHWSAGGRWIVFLLAASSIACLLFDFYRLCPMRIFTLFIFLPAILVLFAFALLAAVVAVGAAAASLALPRGSARQDPP